MLKRLFRRSDRDRAPGGGLDYGEQKRLVQDADPEVRRRLASREDVRPEILYYLAEDDSSDVRRAIAANKAAPVQADLLLARDVDDDVRADLARKIGRMVPNMSQQEQQKVRELTIRTLELLAQDQLPRVRAILAEELKRATNVPRHVIRKLAEDAASIVAAPILEYSPLLSDADLLEIIAAGTAGEALDAIARRRNLAADVSDAVVATLDVSAVASLLANESAQIREETLDRIIDHAGEIAAWHEPLVMRPELSLRAVRRIAGFVASSLVEILAARHDLDQETAAELASRIRSRIHESSGEELEEAERAKQMLAAGLLDDDAVEAAVAAARRSFVMHALSLKSGLPTARIERIARSRSAKGITSLTWKAGLSMRTALRLQSFLGHIPPAQMLHARNGTDYPLSPEEMTWQLEALP